MANDRLFQKVMTMRFPSFRSLTLLSLLWVTFGAAMAADAPLAVHTDRADANGFNVASVLVTGKTDAVLIDAQYTRADAHRLVAEVLASGKKLKTVYISQGDPDDYFGLEVIQQAFPDIKIIASKPTVDHIKASLPEKMKIWGPKLGANGPKKPIVPQVLAGNSFELEGQKLEVIGLDGPSPLYTFVWIPSIKAAVGGVRVFGDMHLWTTDSKTPAARQCWIDDLKRIESLAPVTVVAGHAKKEASLDLSTVRYSKDYLAA